MEKKEQKEDLFCLISHLNAFEGNLFDKPQDRTDFKWMANMKQSAICNDMFKEEHPSVKIM